MPTPLLSAHAALQAAIAQCVEATHSWHAHLEDTHDPSPLTKRQVYWFAASNGAANVVFGRPANPQTAHERLAHFPIIQRQQPVLDALDAAIADMHRALSAHPILSSHLFCTPAVAVRAVWQMPNDPRPVYFALTSDQTPNGKAKIAGPWRQGFRRYNPQIVQELLEAFEALRPDQASPDRARYDLPLWDITHNGRTWRARADTPEHARIFAAGSMNSGLAWPNGGNITIARSRHDY